MDESVERSQLVFLRKRMINFWTILAHPIDTHLASLTYKYKGFEKKIDAEPMMPFKAARTSDSGPRFIICWGAQPSGNNRWVFTHHHYHIRNWRYPYPLRLPCKQYIFRAEWDWNAKQWHFVQCLQSKWSRHDYIRDTDVQFWPYSGPDGGSVQVPKMTDGHLESFGTDAKYHWEWWQLVPLKISTPIPGDVRLDVIYGVIFVALGFPRMKQDHSSLVLQTDSRADHPH